MRMNKSALMPNAIDTPHQTFRTRQTPPPAGRVDIVLGASAPESAGRRSLPVAPPTHASQAAWRVTEWGETTFEPRAV
jgi:hypothetical protein